ncbi:uncharacterized protein LOC108829682 [Raphanus sativus]|uniref:Uncharacterized protein LOC108829682 n=1 Tax=Raphanus sativus TaxID=3726 RepID=A0A9W3CNH3_RAPSA|nr:uncharacterized protein LOC108829682 [Raphanus sativus]
MAKTGGGGQIQHTVKKRTTKKVAAPTKALVLTPTRRSSRIKKVAAQADEVEDELEDVTPEYIPRDDELEDVTPEYIPRDDEVEYVTPEDVTPVADQAEKARSEDDKEEGEACLKGQEQKEDDGEPANMVEDEVLNEEGNEEVSNAQDDEIPSNEGVELPREEVKEKNRRGPTKMRRVAENPNEKVAVTFTDFGEHVGPGSVTLSSFLGPLVREHVPVTLSDWRRLDAVTKATMWEEIQGRFNLQEEWHKAVIFKQLGSLWRAGKSRLVSQVRAAKTAAERLKLKPSNVPSIQVWNTWVRSKTTSSFTEISNRYRELRKNQIPHTISRKGMIRLAYDMKKKSQDPKKVSRSKVWIAGHTHADGRPVKPQYAETIEQIQSLDSQMDSTSAADNIREDAVTKILGKDKPGRVRGFGRGITATKLAFLQSRDAKIADMASEIEELKGMKTNGETETSETSAGFKEGVRVQILDWFESEDVVVGEGEFCSDEPMYKIGRVPIGPNAVAVIVKSALISEAFLWRPTTDVLSLGDAVGCKVAWPINKVVLDRNPVASQDVSMQHKEGETRRCKIYDWTSEEEEVIAEGLLCSSNSKEMVNNIPLGPNAVSIEVVKVFKDNAHLWRPTAEMFLIGDAINEKIAWPLLKFEIMASITAAATPAKPAATKTASPTKPAKKKAMSPGSTSTTKSAKQKCILFDCSNTGRKVAEGRVASTDPKELCHFVPLGPNASKVWVEVAKIGDAKVWRPNSEIEYISDAIGSVVAWPNDKLKLV